MDDQSNPRFSVETIFTKKFEQLEEKKHMCPWSTDISSTAIFIIHCMNQNLYISFHKNNFDKQYALLRTSFEQL